MVPLPDSGPESTGGAGRTQVCLGTHGREALRRHSPVCCPIIHTAPSSHVHSLLRRATWGR